MLILNSKGLNTSKGCDVISSALEECGLSSSISTSTMYVVTHPIDEMESFILNNLVNYFNMDSRNIRFSGYDTPDEDYFPDIIYVSEGNTFEMLSYIKQHGIGDFIKKRVNGNQVKCYIGSSAGASIAGTDIELMKPFNRNYVHLEDFRGLELFNGCFLPHFTDEKWESYRESLSDEVLERYYTVYHVDNDSFIILNN